MWRAVRYAVAHRHARTYAHLSSLAPENCKVAKCICMRIGNRLFGKRGGGASSGDSEDAFMYAVTSMHNTAVICLTWCFLFAHCECPAIHRVVNKGTCTCPCTRAVAVAAPGPAHTRAGKTRAACPHSRRPELAARPAHENILATVRPTSAATHAHSARPDVAQAAQGAGDHDSCWHHCIHAHMGLTLALTKPRCRHHFCVLHVARSRTEIRVAWHGMAW